MENYYFRPVWDEHFLSLAKTAALRADCRRSRVGAIVVTPDNQVAGEGYNGSQPGDVSCLAGNCERGRLSYEDCPANSDYGNCIAVHAEQNAVENAQRSGLPFSKVYTSRKPCSDCVAFCQANGVAKIIWREDGTIVEMPLR